MKLLSHTCPENKLDEAKQWLTKEVGLQIFRTHKIYSPEFNDIEYQIIVIVIDEDTESYLKLKYPPGTFRDFTA